MKINKTIFGFTLVELLVTIIILGVLAAIAIPKYVKHVEQQKGEMCINSMRQIHAAERIYFMRNNDVWPDDADAPTWSAWYDYQDINSSGLNINIFDPNFSYTFMYQSDSQRFTIVARRKQSASEPYRGDDIRSSIEFDTKDITWYNTSWFDDIGFPIPEY